MSKSVALIGDLIIDKFKNYSSKLSPEGPAPVVKNYFMQHQEVLQM